jgi:hypothetical protein
MRAANEQELWPLALFAEALRLKPLEHQFRDQHSPCRPMMAIGG